MFLCPGQVVNPLAWPAGHSILGPMDGTRLSKRMHAVIQSTLVMVGWLALAAMPVLAVADETSPATPDEIAAARETLVAWTSAYQAGEYREQWGLTDPRIRHWHDKERWRGWMKKAARHNGALVTFEIEAVAPADAGSLPCTEQGHCFREGIRYVFFRIRSAYEVAEPAQPEWAVMAESEEGWRFGGGTFLNRPLGETSVIMTRRDEDKYKARVQRW